MATTEELQAQIAQLTQQLNQQRLAGVPESQRAQLQTQMELEAEREALRAERATLNEAGRVIEARTIAARTGLSEDSLLEHGNSLSEMREYALEQVSAQKSSEIAALIRGESPGAAATPGGQEPGGAAGAPNPAGQAPAAASAEPATTSAGGAGGTAALGSDPVAEILDRKDIGRGSGRLEEYIGQVRGTVGFEDVSLGAGRQAQVAAPPPTEQPASSE